MNRDQRDKSYKGDVDAIAVKQCVPVALRRKATAEPGGLPAGWEMRGMRERMTNDK
jgi:hypothetical protein